MHLTDWKGDIGDDSTIDEDEDDDDNSDDESDDSSSDEENDEEEDEVYIYYIITMIHYIFEFNTISYNKFLDILYILLL